MKREGKGAGALEVVETSKREHEEKPAGDHLMTDGRLPRPSPPRRTEPVRGESSPLLCRFFILRGTGVGEGGRSLRSLLLLYPPSPRPQHHLVVPKIEGLTPTGRCKLIKINVLTGHRAVFPRSSAVFTPVLRFLDFGKVRQTITASPAFSSSIVNHFNSRISVEVVLMDNGSSVP